MEQKQIKKGDWIKIKSSESSEGIDGYVFNVCQNGELKVGYYQNNLKAIKENVIWTGSFWKFKHNGPNGLYLRGNDEAIVKRGPY